MVSSIPSNYPRVTPYLCVSTCKAAIEFYSIATHIEHVSPEEVAERAKKLFGG